MTVGSAAFVVELNELTALKQVHVRVLRKIHGIGHSDKQIISEGENLNISMAWIQLRRIQPTGESEGGEIPSHSS